MYKKEKSWLSVFNSSYRETNPLEWVKRFFRQWKWAYQRAVYGFCDRDTWSIDCWFLNVVPVMLEQLAEYTCGFPADFQGDNASRIQRVTNEENIDEEDKASLENWRATLRLMALKLRDADEDQCSMKNPYQNEYDEAYEEFNQKYGFLGCKLEEDRDSNSGSIRIHFPSEFDEWKDVMEKYFSEEKRIEQFRNESLDEGLKMFHKWFWALWD